MEVLIREEVKVSPGFMSSTKHYGQLFINLLPSTLILPSPSLSLLSFSNKGNLSISGYSESVIVNVSTVDYPSLTEIWFH